jgi:uncharacterized membrane protein
MPEEQAQSAARPTSTAVPEHVSQNIADIVELQEREIRAVGRAQRGLERISAFASRPVYVLGLLVGVGGWIAVNLLHARHGGRPLDPPPFLWLQGILTLIALLTATVVLIGQGRQSRLSEQRAHLDLQISLLTEQKVTMLIHLLEELREDLPMVEDRVDPHVSALKEQADPAQVLAALKEGHRNRKRRSEP